jgi:hypothetical protein
MNPFEKFGITHLSPSSCNAFVTAPAMWVMERLLNRKCGVGLPAHAGTATEAGVASGLLNPSTAIEHCQEIALNKFLRDTKMNGNDDRKDKYIKAIPSMVKQAVFELRPFGIPTTAQQEISYDASAEGLLVPFKGYTDFTWDDRGVIVDLKTSLTMSKDIKHTHARQVSLYKHAISDNYQALITTVTGSKCETKPVENTREHLNALIRTGLAIQHFLSISDDRDELAMIVAPDYDHYFWNNPTARGHGFQVWGY